jgi:hypothetical protein
MNMLISAKYLFRILTAVVSLLVIMHIIQASLYHAEVLDYSRFLDFDTEVNLPTFYSALAIMFCALLLLVIYLCQKSTNTPFNKYWLGLSLIFAFLGADEMLRFHEEFSPIAAHMVNATGLFYFPWVLIYGFFTLLLGVIYWPWFKQLPSNIRTQFLVSAIVFVGGAIGLEMIGASIAEEFGRHNWRYTIAYTLEEMLEMIGVLLFIKALLNYMQQEISRITIKITP